MSFYEMLTENENGRVVCTIENDGIRNKGFETARFWKKGGALYSWGASWGTMERDDFTPERFNNHIAAMIREVFKVSFQTL